ncbi:MAG TPA: cold shock domain-containing protein [Geobacteraceae bacterium]|nr:cold shock domain-containing protein [Geobacteraceae bacterium]
MARGKVIWFSDDLGYGYIEQDNGEEVLCHFSDIIDEDIKPLQEGDEVEFDLVDGLRGLQAVNVEKI